MANMSSQSADWERTNTRAQNALNKAVKAEPKTIPSAGNGRNITKAFSAAEKSRAKIAALSKARAKAATPMSKAVQSGPKKSMSAQEKEMADFASGKYNLSVKDVKSGKGGKDWTEYYNGKK